MSSDKPIDVILQRREIRRNFESWARYRMAKVDREPAKHHLLIINTVQALVHNELDERKVMILMPPGSAKSTYTSQLLPAWFCNPEQFPRDLMLACSYSFTLAQDFGKIARDTLIEEAAVLGMGISPGAEAAGNWRTTLGGGYLAAGVNAGIAGRRCRLGLIDDYIGSEEEADSQLIRDKNWKWYWNDFLPRLVPDAWQFLIANRRHEDDLVGRLLEHRSAKNWLVIRLPMIAEDANDPLGRAPGERLWPEWFTESQVEDAKSLPRTWAGLYQQRPSPEEGDYFKKDWIVGYTPNELPKDLRPYVGSDYALRKANANDDTCFLPAGVDSNGGLWILPNWVWGKYNTLEAVNEMIRLCTSHKPVTWFAGRENITGSIAPFLYEKMRDSNVFIPIEEISESADKQQKAQSIKARMQARTVHFPTYLPGWEKAEHQLLTFPNGKHDDFVDALAKLGQGLSKMVKATKATPAWDRIIPEQPLTCGWLKKSDKRRARLSRRELASL